MLRVQQQGRHFDALIEADLRDFQTHMEIIKGKKTLSN